MILKGNVKKGLGNANFWVRKIEKYFYEKEGLTLFHGTLNIELKEDYELKNYWIIPKNEYGGTQDVYVEECQLLGDKSYIVRSEKTAHKSNIVEIVSDVNFREKYNLQDNASVKIEVI